MKTDPIIKAAFRCYPKVINVYNFQEDLAKEDRDNFINGAKWQAERMYSKEDMRKAYFSGVSSTREGWNGEYAGGNSPNIEKKFSKEFTQWFKQNKKK